MDSIQQFLSSPMVLIFFTSVTTLYVLMWRRRCSISKNSKRRHAPEPAGAWPIIGHLHLLLGPDLPHITLESIADKLGPIFMLRMGVRRAVVVSNWEVAKECFTTNDLAFASRPSSLAGRLMGYNYAMFGLGPYGPYWRRLRKIVMLEVLSNNRLESLKHVKDLEVSTSLKELHHQWATQNNAGRPVLVDMQEWFGNLALNLVLRMIAGKRYYGTNSASSESESRRWRNAMTDFMRLLGSFVVEDAVPYLGWLDLQGSRKEMKNTAKELDNILQGWLEENRRKKNSAEATGEQDFIDMMMSILEVEKISDFDADTINKATCLNLMAGGSDTIPVSLTWAVSLLLNNQHALKKAQDELDICIGKDRQVQESDLKNLPYLQAIVKETMRMYPAGPLSGARVSTEDCHLAGYHVPDGSLLIVNLWKIQRDPTVWSDPSDFRPERFLTRDKNVDVRGQNYELIPFGSGRRICPAISLSLQVVHLSLARLLHQFEVTTQSNMLVDMTGSAGAVNVKKTPLEETIEDNHSLEFYIFYGSLQTEKYHRLINKAMDSVHQGQYLPTPMITLLVFFISLYFLILWRRWSSSKTNTCKEAPEAPGAWPIIGHLHLLGGSELRHKTLGAMADKYGPIFKIRIGVNHALVVSNSDIAKECFTTNDKAFASRPTSTASKILGYDYVMFGMAPYGQYWVELRKITMSELLSNRRLELLKHVRDSEINTSIQELYKVWKNHDKAKGPVLVDMKQWFGDLTLNVILRMIAGKRYSGSMSSCDETEARTCQKGMRDFFRLLGLFIIEDALPYLSWLDLQGYKKEMKNTAKELDSVFQRWLEEHKRMRQTGELNREQDFMDVLMSILEDTKISEYDNDTIIKSTCLSIVTGGSDTTMVTLTWILSLLLNNKHALKKAQDELDSHVGKDRHVEESDIKNLIYLQAITKEALRLYPAGPLSGPRVADADCTVAGYHVPAGTRLIVNTYKIQRDPLVWSEPSEFRPERFLTSHVNMDIKGLHYELIPFGAGRRACPGMSFTLQVVPLVLARFLHEFESKTEMDMPVDMTETAGLTNAKATPLEVVITPRLHPEIYGL
ncbi:hypothetical protein IFM89_010054 [Coptis chinensis]|uniref:Cytochrome P450 n=1 Tax=Coptis chinensis TaxID=261450 RepID=A0A835HP96_9MAGN|nr:hypothetical protein IFM89_010054 [Coptis chinensis]